MATAAIVISQQGKPQAVPGKSRADLSAGAKVVLTNNDNTDVGSWTWELSPPPGSKAALSGGTNPVASFTPDVPGSYIVKVTLGGPGGALSDRRVAAVGTPFLGLRKPSAAERGDFDPVQNQWSAVQEAFDLIDADAARGLKADGSNSPTADIRWKGHRITELGGVELEGPLRLGKSGDPEAVEGKAFLYLKEIGGGLDLFYCAPDGSLIRLTRDGRLNVPASFDDRIRLDANDDAPGYFGAKLKASGGLRTREINGALWVEPVFGSEPGTVCAGDDPRLAAQPVVVVPEPQPCGTQVPAPGAVPKADERGTLDAWVSKAESGCRGTMMLRGDLGGSADEPAVVGLRGRKIPEGEGFLRWSAVGLEFAGCGSEKGTVCAGDDPRLSNPRQPIGKAGGQLAGSFPVPKVVGLTDGDGRQLRFGSIPDNHVLACQGDRIIGINPSGRRAVAMVLNEETGSGEPVVVGCFMLDGGADAAPVVFQAICRVTRLGLSGIVDLRNATDDVMVAEMVVGETSFACKRTAVFRPAPGKRLYEARIRLSGKPDRSDDRLVCMWAGLVTDQYM